MFYIHTHTHTHTHTYVYTTYYTSTDKNLIEKSWGKKALDIK